MDMNRIFPALVAIAFVFAAYAQLDWMYDLYIMASVHALQADSSLTGTSLALDALARMPATELPPEIAQSPMDKLTIDMLDAAKGAVNLAIGLVGAMTFFLGLMKVAEKGGLLTILARLIRPMMVVLFPDIPPDHPAMGAMILNMSANALGLGNAATPFGIRAMQELDSLNKYKGTATNAMILFLAINTSSVTLLPTGVIALRATMGSQDPGGILPTTLFATLCSTSVAILGAKLLQRFTSGETTSDEALEAAAAAAAPAEAQPALHDDGAYPGWVSGLALTCLVLMVPLTVVGGRFIAPLVVPLLTVGLLGFGWMRGVAVYETLVEGAKDGFNVATRIIPFLVAILVAVAMLRSTGAVAAFVSVVGPYTSMVGLPGEALPMAILRPLSGSGAYGIMTAIMETEGPDSYVGYLVSTLQGSTETTFYVLAVYFGAVGIKRVRHAVFAALLADLAGVIGAIVACSVYLWLQTPSNG